MRSILKLSWMLFAVVFVVGLVGCSQSAEDRYQSILQNSSAESISDDLKNLKYRTEAKDFSNSEWRDFFNSEEVKQATYEYCYEKSRNGSFDELTSYVSELELTINVSSSENSGTVQSMIDGLSKGFRECKDSNLDAVTSSMEAIRRLGSQLEKLDVSPQQCGLGLSLQDIEQLYGLDEPIVLTEGMEGYYSNPENMEEDVHEGSTASYREGFGSALQDAQRDETWRYFGDYAVKKTSTARDALTNKPGEPVDFTYETSYAVFQKGKTCNLPDNLEGAQVFGGGRCVVVEDTAYFQNEDDPSSFLKTDLIAEVV